MPQNSSSRHHLRQRSSRFSIALFFVLLFSFSGCRLIGLGNSADYEHLEAAEQFSREGKLDEAIASYREHMRYRLSLPDRPDWENPYLYLLMIGDLQLNQSKPDAAQASYELAEKNKVDSALVSDRYRYLASWYEKQGDFDTALKVLTTYRNRDELLFDVMRDRLAKELVKKEQLSPTASTAPTPTNATR